VQTPVKPKRPLIIVALARRYHIGIPTISGNKHKNKAKIL
jgi:hypothetical protein